MLKRLLVILAAVWALAIAAQHPPLHYYNPAEYSGGTQNWCVAHGFGGQMMFGNNYGLLAFDSRHWEMTNVPNYTTVRAVYYDEASRKVYVGASDEFGYFVGRDYTSLSQALTKSADRQTRESISGEIWNIFPLADRVVMQSKTHIFFIDKADHTRVVRMPARIETSAPAPDGTAIVATGKGIYTLSPTGQPRQVALTGLPDDAVVRQIVASPASGAEAAEPGTTAAKAEAARGKENIASDDNWDKFEQNFNLVYDAFMSKLSERFPGLKPSDKRLCAYLRMGLSTKEIASLMNTAPRSIETARYRLRKKLDLTNGENLVDFLQNFDS